MIWHMLTHLSIEFNIRGRKGVQTINISIEHAERCCYKYHIMNFRSRAPSLMCKVNHLPAFSLHHDIRIALWLIDFILSDNAEFRKSLKAISTMYASESYKYRAEACMTLRAKSTFILTRNKAAINSRSAVLNGDSLKGTWSNSYKASPVSGRYKKTLIPGTFSWS